MISNIIFLAITFLIFLFTIFYNPKKGKGKKFHNCLCQSLNNRKLFCNLTLVFLLILHIIYNIAFPTQKGIMLSTFLLIYMASIKRTHKMFLYINSSKSKIWYRFFVVISLLLISYFNKTSLMLGYSLGIVLIASLVYPKQDEIKDSQSFDPNGGSHLHIFQGKKKSA